jgi:predicted nucleic acid-binding protein
VPRIYFVDTSALSKRYILETGTSWLQTTLNPSQGCSVYVARITTVELIAAIARRERAGTILPPDAAAARAAFRAHISAEYQVVEVTETLANRAMLLAETHALRGYDAVQLAAALTVNASYRAAGLPSITLLSSDTELNVAAVAEGLIVDNPNSHP